MKRQQVEGIYIRVTKEAFINIPNPDMTYEEVLEYANQEDSKGNLEFDLHIDVLFKDGTVANEAGWGE
jgi:hypothetical protein